MVADHGEVTRTFNVALAEHFPVHGEYVVARHQSFQPVFAGRSRDGTGRGASVPAEHLDLRLRHRAALRIEDAPSKAGSITGEPTCGYC